MTHSLKRIGSKRSEIHSDGYCGFVMYIYIYIYIHIHTGPIVESKSMHAIFQKKGQQKGKLIESLRKNAQNFETILQKGSLLRATVTCMKQLEHALIY